MKVPDFPARATGSPKLQPEKQGGRAGGALRPQEGAWGYSRASRAVTAAWAGAEAGEAAANSPRRLAPRAAWPSRGPGAGRWLRSIWRTHYGPGLMRSANVLPLPTRPGPGRRLPAAGRGPGRGPRAPHRLAGPFAPGARPRLPARPTPRPGPLGARDPRGQPAGPSGCLPPVLPGPPKAESPPQITPEAAPPAQSLRRPSPHPPGPRRVFFFLGGGVLININIYFKSLNCQMCLKCPQPLRDPPRLTRWGTPPAPPAPSTHLAPRMRPEQAAWTARARRALGTGGGRPRGHRVRTRPDLPRRRTSSRRAAAAGKRTGAETGRPASPPPRGARRGAGGDPGRRAQGARGHLHRRQVHGAPRGVVGGKAPEGPGRALADAAGSRLRPLPGSHSSPGRPPGAVPEPDRRRRRRRVRWGEAGGRASQPGAPPPSEPEWGCCPPPPPPSPASSPRRPPPPGRRLRSVSPATTGRLPGTAGSVHAQALRGQA